MCIRDRYQAPPDKIERFVTSESPEGSLKLLLARRLIEAGVRVVSLTISDFDTHSKNFPRMRQMAPIIDQGLTALVDDLDERGMLDDVTIVAWGEFGRTPQINKNGGRDHWPRVSPAFIVGGGCQSGQVIGNTDRLAGSPPSVRSTSRMSLPRSTTTSESTRQRRLSTIPAAVHSICWTTANRSVSWSRRLRAGAPDGQPPGEWSC